MFEKIKYYINLYRIYYRIYYYLFGTTTINNPKTVFPPPRAIVCQIEIDTEMQKHHNFLYAPIKPMKWFYWRRKFAFRIIGTTIWFKAPKLTPWSYENGTTKFGLNFTLVQKYPNQRLEFITWL